MLLRINPSNAILLNVNFISLCSLGGALDKPYGGSEYRFISCHIHMSRLKNTYRRVRVATIKLYRFAFILLAFGTVHLSNERAGRPLQIRILLLRNDIDSICI